MKTLLQTVAALPHAPGVYMYTDKTGETIYVGKAKDLKKRVSQYFQRDDAVGEKTCTLVSQIYKIKTIITDSEFDALLLEAKLIREQAPKYNVISRDDKSPLYIAITVNEPLPRLLWLRKTALALYPRAQTFGPFQSGRIARRVVRDIRRIIPYCTQKERNGKPCFYTHLGLCDPCPSALAKMPDSEQKRAFTKRYKKNIRSIASILSGKSLTLLHGFEKEMQRHAKINDFEEANRLKLKILGIKSLLSRHIDPNVYVAEQSILSDLHQEEARALVGLLRPYFAHLTDIHRIECFDISNTQGSYATGSMVVLVDGIPDTSQYRRFRIRTRNTPNDFAMMAEIVSRRFKHSEWEYPQLVVIDGGKGQVSAAMGSIPIIGLAKRFEQIIVPTEKGWKILNLAVSHKGLLLLMRVRDESHRFAVSYHRLLRRKAFL